MADQNLPPGVTLDDPVPKSITLDVIGGQMLRNAQRELPSASLGDMGKAAVMPTVGMVGGGMLGQRFGGEIGKHAGQAIGSSAGTAANMAAGLQPPSLWDLGQAAVAPLAGRTIGGIARQGMISGARQLPGYAAAGHELASVKVKGIPDLVRPNSAAAPMYEQLKAMPEVQIPTRPLAKTVRQLADIESNAQDTGKLPGLQNPGLRNDLLALAEALEARPTMPFNQYWLNVQQIGAKVGEAQRSAGAELGAQKLMYKFGMQGLEQAADRYPLLKSANEANKKELAAEALHEVITNKVITPTSNGLIQIQPQILRRWLANTDNADTVKNLSKEDVAGIHKILTVAERLPRLPPPAGQAHGSGAKIATGAWGSLFGGAAGGALGGMPGAGVGAAVMAPAFIAANSIVTKALTSDIGRKALMKVMDRGPFLDHAAIAALAVAINAGAKAQPPATE